MWGDATPPTLGAATPGTAGRRDQKMVSGLGSSIGNLAKGGKKIVGAIKSEMAAKKAKNSSGVSSQNADGDSVSMTE